jgi:hypothetical protein
MRGDNALELLPDKSPLCLELANDASVIVVGDLFRPVRLRKHLLTDGLRRAVICVMVRASQQRRSAENGG